MHPPTDLKEVIDSEIKCVILICMTLSINSEAFWNYRGNGISVSQLHVMSQPSRFRLFVGPDIYFHQRNADAHHAALELRDAVLRLRQNGAFVAVPLFRVNTEPIGPHPVGRHLEI